MNENKVFVVQIKRSVNGDYSNNVHTKATEDEALHQFHAFLSTYAYGNDPNVDYCACYVYRMDGSCVEWKVVNRIQNPQSQTQGENGGEE